MTSQTQNALLDAVAARARDAGVFASVNRGPTGLTCPAQGADAEYRLGPDASGKLWVSLVTADRWLSESIETELLHTGDKLEELVEDELVDLGHEGGPLKVEHFRSEDLLFTFRSVVPADPSGAAPGAEIAAICLLAYEACFRQLGDMAGETED